MSSVSCFLFPFAGREWVKVTPATLPSDLVRWADLVHGLTYGDLLDSIASAQVKNYVLSSLAGLRHHT